MVLVLTLGLAPAGGRNDPPPGEVIAALPADPNQPPAAGAPAGSITPAGPTNWFEAWNQLKKDLEQTTGTSFSVTLDDHMQAVLSGPGEGRERNLFWWNVQVTQKLWPDAKLVARIRGSTNAHGQDDPPPHGIYRVVRPKMNMDWMWSETQWVYLANLYLEQKLLDKKLTIAVGKVNEGGFFDTNNVATADFLSHSIMKNQILPHRYHTIGAIVRYDVAKWVYVQAGAIDVQGIRSET
ncbi:MAG: carbohydrate porin, partial [Phycisphaerae bacterium]|nr:carbohydrate porin [Phycisphaerae bacterium]